MALSARSTTPGSARSCGHLRAAAASSSTAQPAVPERQPPNCPRRVLGMSDRTVRRGLTPPLAVQLIARDNAPRAPVATPPRGCAVGRAPRRPASPCRVCAGRAVGASRRLVRRWPRRCRGRGVRTRGAMPAPSMTTVHCISGAVNVSERPHTSGRRRAALSSSRRSSCPAKFEYRPRRSTHKSQGQRDARLWPAVDITLT